jgi:hypothetical protein
MMGTWLLAAPPGSRASIALCFTVGPDCTAAGDPGVLLLDLSCTAGTLPVLLFSNCEGIPASGVPGRRGLDGGLLLASESSALVVPGPVVPILPVDCDVVLLLMPGGVGQGKGASLCTLPGDGETVPSCLLPLLCMAAPFPVAFALVWVLIIPKAVTDAAEGWTEVVMGGSL